MQQMFDHKMEQKDIPGNRQEDKTHNPSNNRKVAKKQKYQFHLPLRATALEEGANRWDAHSLYITTCNNATRIGGHSRDSGSSCLDDIDKKTSTHHIQAILESK